MVKRKRTFLSVWWPLIAAFGAFIFFLITTVFGLFVFNTGLGISVTLYGGVVILRQIWLQRAAYLHNAEVIANLAAPIVSELTQRYPAQSKTITRISKRHQPFDRMRSQLYALLDLSDNDWYSVREANFAHLKHQPIVMGLAPIYDIPWEQIEAQAWSIVNQTYPVSKFWFVVNDATDLFTIERILELIPKLNEAMDEDDVFQLYVEPTPGKREAMFQGFNWGLVTEVSVHNGRRGANEVKRQLRKSDIVLNSDGDTELDMDAVANMVQAFLDYPDVVLVTGDVRVTNYNVNLLTRYTALRYWVAFWKERAAQSWVRKYQRHLRKVVRGQMICGSGPFLGIRSEYLAIILDEWFEQTFLGKRTTYGDDRHLTTLCLLRGWGTMFISGCVVWTDAPTEIRVWRNQQKRWTKSAYRENWWIVANGGIERLGLSVIFDLFYLTFFPFLIGGAVASVLIRALQAGYQRFTPALMSALNSAADIVLPYMYLALVIQVIVYLAVTGLPFPGARLIRKVAPVWNRHANHIVALLVIMFGYLALRSGFDLFDQSVAESLYGFWSVVLPYLVVILTLQFVFHSLYGFLLTGDWFFLLWPGYNWLYFRYLAIQKITALPEMGITDWATRKKVKPAADSPFKEGEG